jgi:hypothetical protein
VVVALVMWPARAQVTIPTLPGVTTTTTPPPPPETTTTTEPVTDTTTVDVPLTDTTAVPVDPVPVDTVPVATPTATTASTRPTSVPRDERPVLRSRAISAAAVSGSYGVGLVAVAGFALVAITLATRVRQGGPMTETGRNRLYLGVGLLTVAAIVGIVGYLKLSLETDVNRQIPYLASAGMALVVLSAAGGALIVGEQLRADDRRIEELEAAVLALSGVLATSIEAPARVGAPAVLEADAADRSERAEAAETKVVTRRTRAAKKR